MMQQGKITGKIYNLSFNKKRILRGWNLIVTDSGDEYLMKRNMGISWKRKWKLYRSTVSLKQFAYSKEAYQRNKKSSLITTLFIFLGIGISRVITRLIPFDYWLGPTNLPWKWPIAVKNIIEVAVLLGIFFLVLSMYRAMKLRSTLKRFGGELHPAGKIQNLTPVAYTPKKKGIW